MWSRVMLSGDANENVGREKSVGLITHKTTLHAQHNFLYISFCRCLAWLQRETSINFLVIRVMGEILEGSSTVTRSNFFPPFVKYASSKELKIPRRR